MYRELNIISRGFRYSYRRFKYSNTVATFRRPLNKVAGGLVVSNLILCASTYRCCFAEDFDKEEEYGQSSYLGEGLKSEFWKAKYKNVSVMELEEDCDMVNITSIRNTETDKDKLRECIFDAVEGLIDAATESEDPEEIEIITGGGYKYIGAKEAEHQHIAAITVTTDMTKVPDFNGHPSVYCSGYMIVDQSGKVIKSNIPESVQDCTVMLFEPEMKLPNRTRSCLKELMNNHKIEEEKLFVASLFSSPSAIEGLSKEFKNIDFLLLAVDCGIDNEGNLVPGMGDFFNRFY